MLPLGRFGNDEARVSPTRSESPASALVRERPTTYRWVVVGASFVFVLVFWSAQSSFSVFVTPLSQDFGGSRGMVSLAFSASLLTGALVGTGVGALVDRHGPRLMAISCAVLMGSGLVLTSLAQHLWQLYLFLGVLSGLGMAGAFIVPTVTISRWFQAQRGLALGLAFTAIGIGYMFGPPAAGYLVASYGWRTAYAILGATVFLVPLPISALLRFPPERVEAGAASSTTRLSLRQALGNSAFWVVFAVWGLQGFSIMSFVTHMVPFATDHGMSLATASTLLTVYGVATTVARPSFGSLADRVGTKPAFSLTVALQVFALLGFLLTDRLADFYVWALLLGLGAAGSDTVITRETPELFGTASLGAIMGAVVIGWRIGAGLGSPFAGFVFDATATYSLALGVAFAFQVAAGLLILWLKLPPRRPAARG